jgi:hypothetical protein
MFRRLEARGHEVPSACASPHLNRDEVRKPNDSVLSEPQLVNTSGYFDIMIKFPRCSRLTARHSYQRRTVNGRTQPAFARAHEPWYILITHKDQHVVHSEHVNWGRNYCF